MKKMLLILLLFLSQIGFTQNVAKKSKVPDWSGSVGEQFKEVYTKAGKYQEYKVIKAYWFQKLKKNTLDSLSSLRTNISNLNAEITKLNQQIDGLKADINAKNDNINALKDQKDNINLFGIKMAKSNYNILLWSIISVLFLLLIFFIYRFIDNNKITKETLENYKELSNEYQTFRSRSLEREQALQRKLLDEVNRNSTS